MPHEPESSELFTGVLSVIFTLVALGWMAWKLVESVGKLLGR